MGSLPRRVAAGKFGSLAIRRNGQQYTFLNSGKRGCRFKGFQGEEGQGCYYYWDESLKRGGGLVF